MGGICSKSSPIHNVGKTEKQSKIRNESSKCSVPVIAPTSRDEKSQGGTGKADSSAHSRSKHALRTDSGSVSAVKNEEDSRTRIIERPKSSQHRRNATADLTTSFREPAMMTQIVSIPHGVEGELIAAGWPSWLTSVAAEAIQGWLPRSADSFEKLDKVGQGTYSSVFRARDVLTKKIVAMKKVRFLNLDPQSVRFMAREIHILRKLDHPNVIKLEALVTSRISGSLYLVFEYMMHDLAGLAASPSIKLTEPQIKCYMQQLFRGLDHCHSRGILHRDIKGSNLLIDNDGVLKIGDFGLATFLQPERTQPLTTHVVSLWYRSPELLFGVTEYGVGIDMWSVGCILAELFAGKPIMPGRTEVEQIHKIFKLCGSPSDKYWKDPKLSNATSFKPNHPYKRILIETFKEFPSSVLALVDSLLSIEPKARGTAASALNSEFFTTKPLPCDPSSLPKYPPSKEFDARFHKEAKRRKAETVRGRGPESVRRGPREPKQVATPEFHTQKSNKAISAKYNSHEESGAGFPIEPPREYVKNSLHHPRAVLHPVVRLNEPSWSGKVKEYAGQTDSRDTFGSSEHNSRQRSRTTHDGIESNNFYQKKDDRPSVKDSIGYVPKKNKIHYSGPLVPPRGNIEDMLIEHEGQIQEAVRKSRLEKAKTRINC